MVTSMRLFQVLSSFILGTTLMRPVNGLEKGAKSFIMTNMNAKNVIREFEYYAANVMEEDHKNIIVQDKATLFDFKTVKNLDNWIESSDTVRTVGQSKATLVLQKTQVFQRAVFFTLLIPQPNGAGFAGVRIAINLNLSSFKNIEITCRNQGENIHYKVVLRHNGQSVDGISYEQFFTAPMSTESFKTVTMPLANFKAFYRGREVEDAAPLNTSNITMFGLQMYGGVYLPTKQKGVSALEIENIVATS